MESACSFLFPSNSNNFLFPSRKKIFYLKLLYKTPKDGKASQEQKAINRYCSVAVVPVFHHLLFSRFSRATESISFSLFSWFTLEADGS